MRNSILSLLMILATVYAAPVAAQSVPDYEAPARGELEQLRQRAPAELCDVRGGDARPHAALSQAERERIEEMTGGQVMQVQRLSDFRAGDRAHIHWGVWVAIPSACSTVALVVLLILILL